MDITPLIPQGSQLITGYGEGKFTISGETHESAVLITRAATWPLDARSLAEVTEAMLAPLEAEEVELLLVGAGARFQPLPVSVHAVLKARRVAVEVMDTGAAARTYNVLMAEGRLVAALLLPV